MHSTSFRSLICILLFDLFCNIASSRHIDQHHRLHRHRHVGRETTSDSSPIYEVSVSVEDESSSSAELGDEKAVISDVEEIQKGLSRLPEDLMKFLNAVEQRLEGLENIVSALLSGSTETAVTIQSIPPEESLTNIMPIPAPTTTPRVPLCLPAGGAGPLTPCTPLRRTRTITHTRHETVTNPFFPPRVSRTAIPYGTRTAPWFYPVPYHQPGGGPLMTGTAEYVSPSSTVNVSTIVGSPTAPYTSPSPPMYTFDANAPDNVAVYYGQSPDTQRGGLLALCQDVNVDITILAFVYDFFNPSGYPSYQFGPTCSFTGTGESTSEFNDGCPELASEITTCQQIGKKVLVSLGGYIANSSFTSDAEAQQFASTLWNMFGAGTEMPFPRPFGPDVVVDGFDIDNENHNTSYYQTFATALRQLFDTDNSKTYYLSAAPQCPMPDQSIPMEAMLEADFVWVQFYNNPQCNLGSAGFQSSFAAWSGNLSADGTGPGKPRLYIGAAAFSAAGSGYVVGDALSSDVSLVRELNVPNLGGIMLWDGSEAMANTDQYGVNYLEYAKSALDL